MRDFNCFYSWMIGDRLSESYSSVCWAGIRNGRYYDENNNYCVIKEEYSKIIYIKAYTEDLTKKYVKSLVKCINKITPCSIETIDEVKYIKFELFGTYDQNLIVLNFIRNLWSIGGNLNEEYIKIFFDTFAKHRYKDPVVRLTYANIQACIGANITYAHHSNGFQANKAKPKTLKQLLEYKGDSVVNFLK